MHRIRNLTDMATEYSVKKAKERATCEIRLLLQREKDILERKEKLDERLERVRADKKNKLKSILEIDKSICTDVSNAKKNYYSTLTDKLDLDLELIKTFKDNYNIFVQLSKIFDSEEKLNDYIEYLKQIKSNRYIKILSDLCDYFQMFEFAKPMISKLVNVYVDQEPIQYLGGERSVCESKLCFNDNFSFELKYVYDRDAKMYYDYTINSHNDYDELVDDLKDVMEFFDLPFDRISDFSSLMIRWIDSCCETSLIDELDEKYCMDSNSESSPLNILKDFDSNPLAKQLALKLDDNIDFLESENSYRDHMETTKYLEFDNFIIELSYCYHYENCCVYGEEISINNHKIKSPSYKLELEKMMKFYSIDKKYLVEFNKLVLLWIFSCGEECGNDISLIIKHMCEI